MARATALPSGTVTFLFTDIEGSTRLWEQHPEAMRAALARHDALGWVAGGHGQASNARVVWVWAARLMGAAAALFEPLPLPLPPPRRAIHDQTVEAARAALGEEAF